MDGWAEAKELLNDRLREKRVLVLRNSRGRGLSVPVSLVGAVGLEPREAPERSVRERGGP